MTKGSRPFSVVVTMLVALLGSIIGLVSLTIVLALIQSDPDRPFLATLYDAACEVGSTLSDPSILWQEREIARRIVVSQGGEIDFTAIPSHWQLVCLASVASGIELDHPREHVPPMDIRRSVCWNWSPRAITVLAVDKSGVTFPFLLKVPEASGTRDVETDYQLFPRSWDLRQCSPREQAIARCMPLTHAGKSCIYGFGQGSRGTP